MIPNEARIDLSAIRDNFREIKRLAGVKSRILAVVKSDAYGHGMVPVARTLQAAGVDYLGVFEMEEGLSLRKAGITAPVLIMMGIMPEEVPAVVENRLTAAVFQREIAQGLSEKSLKQGRLTPVHVKVDTGMTRLGLPLPDLEPFLRSLIPLKGLLLEGIFTHFAISDQPQHPYTARQMDGFVKAVEISRKLGVCTEAVHVSNSGALLEQSGLDFLMVRPGILLYGSPPGQAWAAGSFRPAMTFRSKVIQVRTVPTGTSISYGCTFRTPSQATIATVPVGYDDGLSRLLSNKGEALIHGTRVPVVGRVCMNLTMVDVTSVEGVAVGDEVVFLGVQGGDRITAEEMAHKIGTISYEVYCSIGKSNRRVYVDRAKED
ncbi:MAG: alanine racemase [Thermodesulfobacteriota bacterium]|nr:alanine racemase [Thermodesulfobacteriota bacterium]